MKRGQLLWVGVLVSILFITLISQLTVADLEMQLQNPVATQLAQVALTATQGYQAASTYWAQADQLWQEASSLWDRGAEAQARAAEDAARRAEDNARNAEEQGRYAEWDTFDLIRELTATAEEQRRNTQQALEYQIVQTQRAVDATRTAIAPTPTLIPGSYEQPYLGIGAIGDGRFRVTRVEIISDEEELGGDWAWAIVNLTFWCDLETDETCNASNLNLELRGELGRLYTPTSTNVADPFVGSVFGGEKLTANVVFIVDSDDDDFLVIVNDSSEGRIFFVPLLQ